MTSTDRTTDTPRILVVALTGGIASGKGAVSERLESHGAMILDADRVARELVRPGMPALAEIASQFGAQVLLPSGELDRARMRELIFADASARRRLEDILHPRVRAVLRAGAQACSAAYCVLVIPLLTEVIRDYDFIDRVLVVDVSADVQLQRLMLRDRSSLDAAEAMIAAQAPRAARLAIAHDVLDNDGDLSMLDAPVARLHALYSRSRSSSSAAAS